MSLNDERAECTQKLELSENQARGLLFYFCVEDLRSKRIAAGKDFGKTFLQKAIAKMQEMGIPLLNYLFTHGRIACSFSTDVQSHYDRLQKTNLLGDKDLLIQARSALKSMFGEKGEDVVAKIEEIADSLKDKEVRDLILESHEKDEEVVRRSKLIYLHPEAPKFLKLKELNMEAEIKEIWIKSIRKNRPPLTASMRSIKKGKLLGRVKTTGFFIPIDYIFNHGEKSGKIVAILSDSRSDLSQSCISFITQNATIQAFSQYENLFPEGEFLILGETVPNTYNSNICAHKYPLVAEAPFGLNVLAILQVILGYRSLVTSVDECAKEIEYYAKKDSYIAFQKLCEIKRKTRSIRPKTIVRKIRDFCKYEIEDDEVYPKEHVRPPSETMKSRKGDCKAKACLAYALLLNEDSIEIADLVMLDTEGSGKPDHVRLEVKVRGFSQFIALELTKRPTAFEREVKRFTLPLYKHVGG